MLAPQLTSAEAGLYAHLVDYEATRAGIHPFLVVALVQVESGWNREAKGPTADHGLMQIRVSKTNYPQLLGREKLLYDPLLNLHFGVKLMAYWRRHHNRHCFPYLDHPWWSHMKWGKKVKDGGRSARERAGKVYRQLLKRFGQPGV